MRNFLYNKYRVILIFVYDVLMIPVAWFLAFYMRYNFQAFDYKYLAFSFAVLPLLLIVQIFFYWRFGLYRGVWRFASLPDLIRIIKAAIFASIIVTVILFFTARLMYVPRSIFPLYTILLVILLGGSRLLYRQFREYAGSSAVYKRVLIVGAGMAGESIARDLLRNRATFKPIAFIDDNVKRKGKEIRGLPVLGACNKISKIVKKHNIDLIIIAIPSATAANMARIVDYCRAANVSFQTLPSLLNLTSGRFNLHDLRDVAIEDLLGREQVNLDWQNIEADISNRVIFVTGGGGSIGSQLCEQIIKLKPKKIIIIDHCEYNLYQIDKTIKLIHGIEFHALLADVKDNKQMEIIISQFKPDVIFHAAAYKHVPILENQVIAAFANNVIGTKVVATLACKYNVKKFVLISTDKAVKPTNIMGTTKRIAEILCQSLNNPVTKFITVRFGNVLGSSGSVIPLFKEQLKNGGPITVTHPDITRFFMTIPEACRLILQACSQGSGGEIFVLDMGKPIKISYLAEQMIKLAGKTVGNSKGSIKIEFTGLRPGEKLYEELFYENEIMLPTAHEKIMQAKFEAEIDDANYIITQIFNDSLLLENDDKVKIICNKILQKDIPIVLEDVKF